MYHFVQLVVLLGVNFGEVFSTADRLFALGKQTFHPLTRSNNEALGPKIPYLQPISNLPGSSLTFHTILPQRFYVTVQVYPPSFMKGRNDGEFFSPSE